MERSHRAVVRVQFSNRQRHPVRRGQQRAEHCHELVKAKAYVALPCGDPVDVCLPKRAPVLETVLLDIVLPDTAGEPMGGGKWLNCRLADMRDRLDEQGHKISAPVISRLLRAHDYRLRVNIKALVGKEEPERDVQFQHILTQRAEHRAAGQPRLSVDTKKKELIGNFKNPGRAWGREPEEVDVHGFPPHLVTETYETGGKVPDEKMAALNIEFHDVCPQWNCAIYPRSTSRPG